MKGQRFFDPAHRRDLLQVIVDLLVGRNVEEPLLAGDVRVFFEDGHRNIEQGNMYVDAGLVPFGVDPHPCVVALNDVRLREALHVHVRETGIAGKLENIPHLRQPL